MTGIILKQSYSLIPVKILWQAPCILLDQLIFSGLCSTDGKSCQNQQNTDNLQHSDKSVVCTCDCLWYDSEKISSQSGELSC